MATYAKVGEIRQFRKGRGRQVEVGGVKVAVFWTGENFIALGDTCPHMGASLADGTLGDDKVICRWHHWAYDAATGQAKERPWAHVPVYEVRVDGDDVLVRVPDPFPPDPREADREEEEPEWLSWDPSRFFKKKEAE